MKISYLYEKGIGETNDDAYTMNDANCLYGVMDGATGLDGMAGNIASLTVQHTLSKISDDTLMKRMELANKALRHKVETYFTKKLGRNAQFKDILKSQRSTTGVAAIQLNKEKTSFDYIHAADCMIFLQYENGDIRPLTYDVVQYLDRMAIEEVRYLRNNSNENDFSMEQAIEKVKPLLVENRMKLNTNEGYGIIDGSLEALDHLEYGKVSLKRVKQILLLTDGLQLPLLEGQTGTWENAVDLAFNFGLERLYEEVYEREMSDPKCERYVRLKMRDDKTAILLEL